ncbi:MAG: 50S ribosomal protein L9 [Elusimicrobia bacterium RIFOXYB2_FULL_49_7]|nr:MAG: 50S ribosomal protein L9 [Elusimicrobia bacterium RIFOXYB2_FULL_49_7]
MEVILQKDVDRLGKAFELVQVKDGYAQNFLFPGKLALPATVGKKQRIEADRKAYARKSESLAKQAAETAKKFEELSLTIQMKAAEGDKLYGSVTTQVLSEKLALAGYSIPKQDILLEEPIKALGVYSVKVNLHQNVTAEVKVWVVKEDAPETDKA